MSALASAWIPAARERQDELLLGVVAPLLHELDASAKIEASWFERINKPEWGIRVLILGAAEPPEVLQDSIVFHVGENDEEDKWVGGPAERRWLRLVHHRDARACLERIAAERDGAPLGTRAHFSLLVALGLLDLFRLDDVARLDFDRRGFAWEIELQRWDAEVFRVLEEKFDKQQEALRSLLRAEPLTAAEGIWGGPGAARIGRALLASLEPPVREILDARAAGTLERALVDYAVFAARAHVNRLGLDATQEATVRYLSWRARGGRPGPKL